MKRSEFSEVYRYINNPQKCVVAITQDAEGKYNMITLEWFMKTSIDPPMYAISIGHTRYSHACLQKNRYFNLVFLAQEQRDTAILAGSKSGRELDKFAVSGEDIFPGSLAKYPLLKAAVANFECKVVTQVKSGDHTIFVGEVKHYWLDKSKEVLLVSDLRKK
jgi:flavin reductase (DIM6/NTAB) family NADH-FMN oxidoreductase RutF